MSNFHDPLKHVRFLQHALSQDKKPMGIFLAAGCPLSVKAPSGNTPLIPDVAGLTTHINGTLSSTKGTSKNDYDKLLAELGKANKSDKNIEEILSFIRALKDVSSGGDVRGFSESVLTDLERKICSEIVKKLDVSLPNTETPYHKLGSWISIDRAKPIEIFTTNYDLLIEQAFEELSIPYFDGFVGSRQSFFDLRAIEDDLMPKHWTRFWKIHGSINWFQNKKKEIFRSSKTEEIDSAHLIYPSHLKYEQSRKMPYLALLDQLSRFLRQPSSLLIISGYSFNDYHLNDTILNALRSNPNTMVIALLWGTFTYSDEKTAEVKLRYPNAMQLASQRPNLALWSLDEAVIGTTRGSWRIQKEYDPEENPGSCINVIEEPIKDAAGKETDEKRKKYELKLGDFAVFGDFLQALIGNTESSPI